MKTIILIDDTPSISSFLRDLLEAKGFTVVCLLSFEEAETYILGLQDQSLEHIFAFVFDYSLGGGLTSVPLVELVTGILNFDGILLANSSMEETNSILQSKGCNHVCPGASKGRAVSYLYELYPN